MKPLNTAALALSVLLTPVVAILIVPFMLFPADYLESLLGPGHHFLLALGIWASFGAALLVAQLFSAGFCLTVLWLLRAAYSGVRGLARQ
jgi:hypothetical protein